MGVGGGMVMGVLGMWREVRERIWGKLVWDARDGGVCDVMEGRGGAPLRSMWYDVMCERP